MNLPTFGLLAVLAIIAINYASGYECDKNEKGGCNTFSKSGGNSIKTSSDIKGKRKSYTAMKVKGAARSKTGGGAEQLASSSNGKHLAKQTGGTKNGKAGISKSTKTKKRTYVGGTEKQRVGFAGDKGPGQVHNTYASDPAKKKSHSAISRVSKTGGGIETVQSQTRNKAKPKKDTGNHTWKRNQKTGAGLLTTNKGANKQSLTGLTKGTTKVTQTKYTKRKKPSILDKEHKTFESKKEGSKSQAIYAGKTPKIFKDVPKLQNVKNRIDVNQQKEGTKSKTAISGGNNAAAALLGSKATVQIGSVADESKNEAGTEAEFFGAKSGSLTTAKVDSYKEVPCSGNFDNKNSKNPDGFKFNKITSTKIDKQADGSYQFPDCMKIEADIQVAAGISLTDVAASMSMTIPGCGQYRCGAERKCGSLECFYRRLCPEELPDKDRFSDAADFMLSGLADSDICDVPISDSPRSVKIQFTYCPNQAATVKQDKVCDKSLFNTVALLSGSKSSAMTAQFDLYVANDPFSCSDLTTNFKKVACKRLLYAYTAKASGSGVSVGEVKAEDKGIDCANDKNHYECQGLN